MPALVEVELKPLGSQLEPPLLLRSRKRMFYLFRPPCRWLAFAGRATTLRLQLLHANRERFLGRIVPGDVGGGIPPFQRRSTPLLLLRLPCRQLAYSLVRSLPRQRRDDTPGHRTRLVISPGTPAFHQRLTGGARAPVIAAVWGPIVWLFPEGRLTRESHIRRHLALTVGLY
jgi:hypothetical protein